MLEKPDLADEQIVACLRDEYSIAAAQVEFLPLGYDADAGVYRIDAEDGTPYFLKVRKGGVQATSLAVPRALHDAGISQVVAPMPTKQGRLHATAEPFALILYPFVDGDTVMQRGLSDAGWRGLGEAVRAMHNTTLPPELAQQLPREMFVPPKMHLFRRVDAAIDDTTAYTDHFQREIAALWREHRAELRTIADRAETYGQALRRREFPFVVCHADIHTANVLVNPAGAFFIVDWDGAMLAPKERDLMFVTAAGAGAVVAFGERAQSRFFDGYGQPEIDAMAIAYYRCDWVVQDTGEFADMLFFDAGAGDETKADVLRNVRGMFEPGNTVDVALHSAL